MVADWILIAAIVIGAFLRIWQLGTIPSGVLPDETGIGYIAYSLLKTGKTPYSDTNLLALHEEWGGSRPPLYIYSVIPSIALFGLTPFAIRLPSAIYGILSIALLYFIIEKLAVSRNAARAAAVLMAINPWAIQMSRQALLESIAIFLVLSGVCVFLFAKRWWGYMGSSLLFVLSLFAYDAPKVFLPPFLLGLFFLKRKEMKRTWTPFFTAAFIFLAGYLLMLGTTFVHAQSKDYAKVRLIDMDAVVSQVIYQRQHTLAPPWVAAVFRNKATEIIGAFITNYAKVFSTDWLFVNGPGNLQYSLARMGEYYLFELPLFFMGIGSILAGQTAGVILLWWMLAGALPGALTAVNNPLRDSLMMPAIVGIVALGLVFVFDTLRKKRHVLIMAGIGIYFVVAVMGVANYLYNYYAEYPLYAGEWWSQERNEATKFVIAKKGVYTQIFIDGDWALMYAFFARLDPDITRTALSQHQTYKGVPVITLGNIHFVVFDNTDKGIATRNFFPEGALVISGDNGKPKGELVKTFADYAGVRIVYKATEVHNARNE